jgi:hypothetical protein
MGFGETAGFPIVHWRQSFELDKAKEFEWIVEDKNTLILKRSEPRKKAKLKRLDD